MIQYRCVNVRHARHDVEAYGLLTIHERGWAYCEQENAMDPHEWCETGGVALEEVLSFGRRVVRERSDRQLAARPPTAPTADH